MSIRKFMAGAVAAVALAGIAHAGPIQFLSVTVDPTGVGAFPTASNSQQVCPEGMIICAGNVFNNPVGNEFDIVMLTDGLFSASIIDSITPGGSGSFSVLSFALLNAANVVVGTGSLGSALQDALLTAGTYTMQVFYTYQGGMDNGSASWGMTMTTAPEFQRVPEPGTLALMGLALTIIAAARRRRS